MQGRCPLYGPLVEFLYIVKNYFIKFNILKMKKKEGIKITLKAFDSNILDQAVQEIIGTVKRTGAVVKGPIPLPTNIKKFTVIRSPHIYKRSMEQFEIRSIKRLLIIIPTPQTVNALMSLNLSAGVDIKIALNGVNE